MELRTRLEYTWKLVFCIFLTCLLGKTFFDCDRENRARVAAWRLDAKARQARRAEKIKEAKARAAWRLRHRQPLPSTGECRVYVAAPAASRLRIETLPGQNYFIKLIDDATGRPALDIFIRGGDWAAVLIPAGTFHLRCAFADAGAGWYGREKLFGPRTRCLRSKESYTFTKGSALSVRLMRDSDVGPGASIINTAEF